MRRNEAGWGYALEQLGVRVLIFSRFYESRSDFYAFLLREFCFCFQISFWSGLLLIWQHFD